MSFNIASPTAHPVRAATACYSRPNLAVGVCFGEETPTIHSAKDRRQCQNEKNFQKSTAGLLDWYRDWDRDTSQDRIKNDPLLALRGSGKHIWADEHADEYIRRLREGWE